MTEMGLKAAGLAAQVAKDEARALREYEDAMQRNLDRKKRLKYWDQELAQYDHQMRANTNRAKYDARVNELHLDTTAKGFKPWTRLKANYILNKDDPNRRIAHYKAKGARDTYIKDRMMPMDVSFQYKGLKFGAKDGRKYMDVNNNYHEPRTNNGPKHQSYDPYAHYMNSNDYLPLLPEDNEEGEYTYGKTKQQKTRGR